jgi:cyclase
VLRTRVIPCLLLKDGGLVKTVRFRNPGYVGDPINTVRIFNELEVDELAFLDISASVEGRQPNYELLRDIANECFMPLAYGGGIRDLAAGERILQIGFEKLVLNTAALETPELIGALARKFGSQAVIVAIDARRKLLGGYRVEMRSATKHDPRSPVEWAREAEALGAGEILLTSIDREGTWSGFDLELLARVAAAVNIPVIANGGAGSVADIGAAIRQGRASAVGLGSMVVYQSKGMGVLVNFPDRATLEAQLAGAAP